MSVEWRNQNEMCKYPFRSNATLKDTRGKSRLKISDIVDVLIFSLHTDINELFISSITLTSQKVSGVISWPSGTFGTFECDRDDLEVCDIILDDGIVGGRIVFGDDEPFKELLSGTSAFTQEATAIMGTCFIPATANRVSHVLINDTPVFGRLRFRAGDGIQLVKSSEEGIRIHAIGNQVEGDCGFEDPIRNINSVDPNEFGNISVQEVEYATPDEDDDDRQILRVRPGTNSNSIVISLAELNNSP
jgi:hypothetical protein